MSRYLRLFSFEGKASIQASTHETIVGTPPPPSLHKRKERKKKIQLYETYVY